MPETKSKPIIGISMGDPAATAPGTIAPGLAGPQGHDFSRAIVVADAGGMNRQTKFGRVLLGVRAVENVADARFDSKTIDVYDLKNVQLDELQLGKVSAMAGHAAFEAVRVVIELAMANQIDATVTAPIHKEALVMA